MNLLKRRWPKSIKNKSQRTEPMKYYSLLIALITAFGLTIGSFVVKKPCYATQDLELARESVRQISSFTIQGIINPQVPHTEKIYRLHKLFATRFDMNSVSRFVLGSHWRKASKKEQKEFVTVFQDLNIYTWNGRFQNYDGQELVVGRVYSDGKDGAFVDSHMARSGNRESIPVVWRLRWRDDSWKVVDVVIEGISMALTFRKEYTGLLADPKTNVSDLIRLLSERVDSIRSGGI